MRIQLVAACTALTATLALADDAVAVDGDSVLEVWQDDPTTMFDAADVDIDDFKWVARPLVVFANTPADPDYARQVELIEQRIDELVGRDVVILLDADPAAESLARRALRPRGFGLVVVNKEGRVMLRKASPWDVREITRAIDKW